MQLPTTNVCDAISIDGVFEQALLLMNVDNKERRRAGRAPKKTKKVVEKKLTKKEKAALWQERFLIQIQSNPHTTAKSVSEFIDELPYNAWNAIKSKRFVDSNNGELDASIDLAAVGVISIEMEDVIRNDPILLSCSYMKNRSPLHKMAIDDPLVVNEASARKKYSEVFDKIRNEKKRQPLQEEIDGDSGAEDGDKEPRGNSNVTLSSVTIEPKHEYSSKDNRPMMSANVDTNNYSHLYTSNEECDSDDDTDGLNEENSIFTVRKRRKIQGCYSLSNCISQEGYLVHQSDLSALSGAGEGPHHIDKAGNTTHSTSKAIEKNHAAVEDDVSTRVQLHVSCPQFTYLCDSCIAKFITVDYVW